MVLIPLGNFASAFGYSFNFIPCFFASAAVTTVVTPPTFYLSFKDDAIGSSFSSSFSLPKAILLFLFEGVATPAEVLGLGRT